MILTVYCPKCGKENDDDATFCNHCGKRLKGLHTINTSDDKDTNSEQNKKMFLLGAIAVLIVVIAIIGVFTFMSWSNNQNNGLSSNMNTNPNTDNNINSVSSSSIPLSEVYGLAQALQKGLKTNDIREISSVEYKGVSFTKQQCLYIFAKAIDMKYQGLNGNINFKSFGPPDSPLKGVKTTYLTKSEYVDMAQRTFKWMDNHGKAPNYTGIVVAGSPDFGYDGLVLAFAIVIIESENSPLPPSIGW